MSNIYEVTMTGRSVSTNQSSINVYHFWGVEAYVPTVEALTELLTGFVLSRQEAVLGVLSDTYQLLGYEAKDVISGLGVISNTGIDIRGDRAGPASPAQLAWSMKLVRQLPTTKSGGKRYSPIAEADVAADGAMSGAAITANMAVLQAALVGTLLIPSEGDTLTPIILGRVQNFLPVLTPNPISQAVFIEATTQKSRQRGKGS